MTWQPSTVRLVDGTEVLSDSEAYRFECEARHILNIGQGLPPAIAKARRREALDGIEKMRGRGSPEAAAAAAETRKALEQKIMELWKAGQPASSAA